MTTRPVHLIYMHFNSRLRKETNINFDIDMARYLIFQLTSPQGDEQFATFLVASELPHFNSRLCKETNARQTYDYYLTRIFQLTSP